MAVVRCAVARAPGAWGELVQGTVDGQDVLITCPVDRYVWAEATPSNTVGWVAPPGCPLTQAALASVPGGGRIVLRSQLRPGAGMASSTADMCAALAATAALGGRPLSSIELFQRCRSLEPTDGLMFPGLALVDQKRGERADLLGKPPPLAILGIDPGGTVLTGAFHGRPDLDEANRRKEPAVRVALSLAQAAIAAGDPAGLAQAATVSARAHQAILPHPLWEQVRRLARVCGALGVNVAHSGTVIGLLFDPRQVDVPERQRWLARQLRLPVHALRLVGGGVYVKEVSHDDSSPGSWR